MAYDLWNSLPMHFLVFMNSLVLRKLQVTMKSTHSLSAQLFARVERASASYETVTEREKNLERTFRSDLGEVGHFYDVFSKLYK